MQQKEKNELSREKILSAAIAEFGKKGYDGGSVNDMCAENKISKGLIYHYFGSKEAAKRAVFVGGNDYAYLCDDNGDFVDHCYKLKVLNKQGASSELKEEKFAVALPAGDTLIVLTGGTQPQMPCYQIVTFENTFALQYLDEKMSDTLKLLDGVNVVFDDQFVTKVDVANNTLNTMQISSGGDNLKVKNTVSIQEDNASEGYCSIGASGNLTVVELSAAKVESMIGISGVELKLLLTSEQMEELKNMIG